MPDTLPFFGKEEDKKKQNRQRTQKVYLPTLPPRRQPYLSSIENTAVVKRTGRQQSYR